MTTTAAAAVTTTTVPPWANLPQPEMPPLLLQVDGSETPEIRAVCLESARTGSSRIDASSITEAITGWLDRLGVEVVWGDCEAHLALEFEADRQSAEYLNRGTCWPGWTIRSAATVNVAGMEQTWEQRQTYPAPASIVDCPRRADEIGFDAEGGFRWTDVVFDDAFAEMFGDLGVIVMEPDIRDWDSVTWGSVSRDVAPALAWWLAQSPGDALDLMWRLVDGGLQPEVLEPLVPYLIGRLGDASGGGVLGMLEQISGMEEDRSTLPDRTDLAAWAAIQGKYWAWWEARQG